MAKDLFVKCINDTITYLHYIDHISKRYIEKLSDGDTHDADYVNKIKEMRKIVIKYHDDLIFFIDNVYIKDQKHPSSYNPLCKKPRKQRVDRMFKE